MLTVLAVASLYLLAGTVTVATLLFTSRLPRTSLTIRTVLSAVAVWPVVLVRWTLLGRGFVLRVLSLHSAIVRGERVR